MELIYDALAFDSDACESYQPRHAFAFWLHDSRIQGQNSLSLFVNLKDKNNPGLRENVVSGEIPSERLPTEDMASEERKTADLKIKAFQFPRSGGATSRNGGVPVLAMRTSLCFHHGLRIAHRLSLSDKMPL